LYERRDGQRVTVHDIQQAKQQGERFVMLTAYDTLVAGVFDRVGVPLLLVGDTSGQVVFGYPTTVPVTMDHLVPLVQAVVRGTSHALVVGDLPFGAYQESAEVALGAAPVGGPGRRSGQVCTNPGGPAGRTAGLAADALTRAHPGRRAVGGALTVAQEGCGHVRAPSSRTGRRGPVDNPSGR
jgi:Ketopantoate hydroxymethyltransferase